MHKMFPALILAQIR